MRYTNEIIEGIFVARPNRFIAHVIVQGKEEIVHVKNTGRCREILIEGTTVYLERASNPNRKTKYSLIAAYKGDMLINIDSQIPNAVIAEAVEQGKLRGISNPHYVKREVTFGKSRFDVYYEAVDKKGFVEVKGATLEKEGVAMFPDAPTERGRKHVLELIEAVKEGYEGTVLFLVQLKGVAYFTPNSEMDQDFADALKLASTKGVNVLAYQCIVSKDEITITDEIEVRL